MTQRKHFRSGSRIFLFIALLLISWGGYLYLSSNYFHARAVECYTQFGTCPQGYLSELTQIAEVRLLKPLPGDLIKSKLNKFIEIKNISLYRRLPSTLIVSISLRKPLGTVGSQVLGARAISDDEGLIIGRSQNSLLPFLHEDRDFSQGDTLTSSQVEALKILREVSQLTKNPVSGSLHENDLTVFIGNDQKVLLNLQNKPSKWYNTLQVILERSKILSKIPKVIDIRFSDPVLTF